MYKDPKVGGDKIGFFVNPGEKVAASTLGGQGISVVSYSDNQEDALQVHQVVRAARRAEEVVGARRLLDRQVGAARPRTSRRPRPYAADFLTAMGQVKDFWQEPAYAELLQAMQKRVHDYVVADQGTAQEALDLLVKDWTEIFEDEGKIVSRPPGTTCSSRAIVREGAFLDMPKHRRTGLDGR